MPTYTVADAMNLLLDPSTEGHEPPTHLIVEGGDQPNEMKVTFVPMDVDTVHSDLAEVFVAAFRRDEMTAEPFADRDRWYPVLVVLGEPHADAATELVNDGWKVWLEETIGVDEDGDLETDAVSCTEIRVVRRTALPGERRGMLRMPASSLTADTAVCFGDSLMTEFETPEQVRDAWLDAVAVAESRNQRAEADR